jgi:hypothetical protein
MVYIGYAYMTRTYSKKRSSSSSTSKYDFILKTDTTVPRIREIINETIRTERIDKGQVRGKYFSRPHWEKMNKDSVSFPVTGEVLEDRFKTLEDVVKWKDAKFKVFDLWTEILLKTGKVVAIDYNCTDCIINARTEIAHSKGIY